MTSTAYRPRFRRIEARPIEGGEREEVELFDPLGMARGGSGGRLRLRSSWYAVARLLDGERTLQQVADEVAVGVSVERVAEVARFLSEALLLDDERFQDACADELRAFRGLATRPAVGPGFDYEADPLDLRIRVGGLVANDWDMPAVQVAAAITPALDFTRAGRLYSRTYAAMRKRGGDAARVLLLGRSPVPTADLLVPFRRPFDLPFGSVPVDEEAVDALGAAASPDELIHRSALVLERQMLFLRLLFRDVPVVPVLVGALTRDELERATPAGIERVERAVGDLERVLALPGRTVVIAAADLAHVGIAHDSPWRTSSGLPVDLRRIDADCCDHLTRLEPDEAWRRGQERRDPARAANLLGPYLLARLLRRRNARLPQEERLAGSVLGYEQMSGPGEVVTAATVVFH